MCNHMSRERDHGHFWQYQWMNIWPHDWIIKARRYRYILHALTREMFGTHPTNPIICTYCTAHISIKLSQNNQLIIFDMTSREISQCNEVKHKYLTLLYSSQSCLQIHNQIYFIAEPLYPRLSIFKQNKEIYHRNLSTTTDGIEEKKLDTEKESTRSQTPKDSRSMLCSHHPPVHSTFPLMLTHA